MRTVLYGTRGYTSQLISIGVRDEPSALGMKSGMQSIYEWLSVWTHYAEATTDLS